MFYLILTAIWPLVNYISNNYFGLSGYREILILLIALIFAATTGYFIAKKVLKLSIDRLILPVFLATALFFGYATIVEKIIGPYNIFPAIKASYIYLAIFIITVYAAWKISTKPEMQKVAKVLICTVFVLSLINLTAKHFWQISDSKISSSNETASFKFKHKPNVYYVLVDAYGRQDTLKDVTNYDNEPFLKKLNKEGFIISRTARSNYHFTAASLSATMNTAYHKKNENSEFSAKFIQLSLTGINKVRETFRQNGYYIINIPGHWHQMSCLGNEDLCVVKNGYEIYQTFLQPTPLRTFIKFPTYYVDLDSAKTICDIDPKKPKFTFIHIAQIHDAIYDEFGNILPLVHLSKIITDEKVKIRYISSIKIINSKILTFINYIKSKDPKSIIIIQADHGPSLVGKIGDVQKIGLKTKKGFRDAFGIFSAIYIPDYNQKSYQEIKKYFSGPYSLVNTFRYVFAYLSDKKPDLLPEKSYFLYEDRSCAPVYKQDNIEHLET